MPLNLGTEKFIDYINLNFFEKNNVQVDPEFLSRWIYTMGIPPDLNKVTSTRFQNVNNELENFLQGTSALQINAQEWSSHEWLHFIRNLPLDLHLERMEELDRAFNLTMSGNSEILVAWFLHVIAKEYTPAYSQLEKFLTTVGRRKFLVPLYKELVKSPEGLTFATEIYQKARPNYHYVSSNTLDKILDWNP
ncbi:MAG: leukotriene A4 hydrolase C-terminal domain-containing protein [Bacteroidota bacterium]|nr:leukotriene A4 hydrolase C-terminal domain-containing protein [Bacteroidota bacterium]